MRGSRPMPRATSATSAPTSSQTFAISFTKLIFVARNAFEASLTISALGTSVRTTGQSKPAYSAATRSPSGSRSAPMTTRSGRMKSEIAVPSRRNSGFDT